MPVSIVAAIGRERQIGIEGRIPWNLPEDRRNFKKITDGHTVIMGRKTYESIIKFLGRPLPNRRNVIVTRDPNFRALEGCVVVSSFQRALEIFSNEDSEVFVIGGAQIYTAALPLAQKMHITHVDYAGSADTFFPDFDLSEWDIVSKETYPKAESAQYSFEYVVYQRRTI